MHHTDRNVRLYTLPDLEPSSYTEPLLLDKVVGVETDDTAVWLPGYSTDDEPEVLCLQAPEVFGQRLVGFVSTFLAERPFQRYNCHRFGRWMVGGGDSDMDIEPPDQDMISGTTIQRNLALGERAILGHTTINGPEAIHSVIGLGSESNQCLQVTHMYGPLGVASYHDTLAHYGQRLYSSFGVYVDSPSSREWA